MAKEEPQTDVARRIRAARILANVTVEELAERIGVRGLGAKTLGAIEREERPVRRMELAEIARACELPLAFFTIDWSVLHQHGAIIDWGHVQETGTGPDGEAWVTFGAKPIDSDRDILTRIEQRLTDLEQRVSRPSEPTEGDPREAAARALEEAAEQAEQPRAPGGEGTAGQDRQPGSA